MKLYVVGFGGGNRQGMTIEAETALEKSDIIVGYTVYTELVRGIFPDKEYISTGMTKESDRVRIALEKARSKDVSIVCSGDSGVYGMAGLVLEMSPDYLEVEIEIVAGVTAGLSGGAVLGSPLTHDFAVISLSDLLTPMEKIIKRIRCASEADFTIVLYNPSSRKRTDYLKKACDIMLEYKSSDTVCGYVRNIARDGQESHILTLGQLRETAVDMFTTVFIGNSETKVINGRMVTPRGYRNV
ncbi:MAG: precorrin-3B C(17)-methyltransferase [Ruminococcus flavefaciens]|nr:precorrin-3B C(17)-methyltransferase [Ruminococcus flavefaciens]